MGDTAPLGDQMNAGLQDNYSSDGFFVDLTLESFVIALCAKTHQPGFLFFPETFYNYTAAVLEADQRLQLPVYYWMLL